MNGPASMARRAPRLAGWLAATSLLVAGCDRVTELTAPTPFGSQDWVLTDEQLLQVAYSDYTAPTGFYREDPTLSSAYYANTLSIANRLHQPDPPWTELATEDLEQARAWVRATLDNFGGLTTLSSPPVVTERYFEFPFTDDQAHAMRIRVHRASYLTGAPWGPSADGSIGVFHVRPLRSDAVRDLAEYLWWTRWVEMPQGKVLSEYVTQTNAEWRVAMLVVYVSRSQFETTDMIQLWRVVYHVDKQRGAVHKETLPIRNLRGRPR